MYITNKKEFYNLPSGTLYSRWKPVIFGPLEMKVDTIFDDDNKPFNFTYMGISDLSMASDAIFNFLNSSNVETDSKFLSIKDSYINKNIPAENGMFDIDHDDCYNDDELFVIWEKEDVKTFIRLFECILTTAYAKYE